MSSNSQSGTRGSDAVGAYVEGLESALREIAAATRDIIDAQPSDVGSAMWHGHPVWSRGAKPGEQPVCLLKAYAKYVTFGLWNGAAISDPSGRLQPGSRGMASVKLATPDDIDADLFADWLRQARTLAAG